MARSGGVGSVAALPNTASRHLDRSSAAAGNAVADREVLSTARLRAGQRLRRQIAAVSTVANATHAPKGKPAAAASPSTLRDSAT